MIFLVKQQWTNPQITIFIGGMVTISKWMVKMTVAITHVFHVPIPWVFFGLPEAQEKDGVVGGSAQACESHDEN